MLPRQVLPGQFYLITRRCTQRQLLLRPDQETNNAFTYCLIEAAQRYQVAANPTRVNFRANLSGPDLRDIVVNPTG